ncbi:MAG: signal peptide peptidase SppA [Spirochaetaceae bacterium]|jgi:protease-4|nr:signal peptide peptidase SppA [Spirochaetaceae bacterium]
MIQKKKKHTGLIVFIVIIVLLACMAAVSFFAVPRRSPERPVKFFSQEYLAVLSVNGVIQDENKTYNQDWLLDTIGRLKNDRKNLGVFLFIDSPGGSVYEADEVYLALRDYARSGKELRAYLGPLAASGGYYIACAAEHIDANRNTLTGSIGVIGSQSVDLTRLLDTYGIRVTTITAGKNKNMLNFNNPLTAEQRAIMQSIADECYEQFVSIVADARHLSVTQVKTLGDGRIYTASQAKSAALIDGIDGFDESLEKFKTTLLPHTKSGTLEIVHYTYTPRSSLSDFFAAMTGAAKNNAYSPIPKAALEKLAPAGVKYPAYLYMP